jgi:uncharacterized protein (DUF58 family)
MHLYPTTSAVHVAAAGIAVTGVGLLTLSPSVLAWGGGILVGLAVARAVTLLGVARVRAAGFEMLWREAGRVRRVGRGDAVELAAEVRNRDTRAARYVSLRVVAAPDLGVVITPSSGEVPAGGRLAVSVRVTAPRVGRHGIYGLSLEVRGSPGLFEIPLTFANPFGIEVLPAAYGVMLRSARGGRSRMLTEEGRAGPLSGDGSELREIREHRAGDPFKKVAWKASARRGKLMVRDHEQEERDVVWLMLDASVELWSGVAGKAPLDHAIDEAAAVAEAHLGRGDHVGLVICAGRVLAHIRPGRGPSHTAAIMAALSSATGTLETDRSGLDATDVAQRVIEHLRPLDGEAVRGLGDGDREALARHAERAMARAPFPPLSVHAVDAADRILRGYLSAFGLTTPPRLEPERPRTDDTLAAAIAELPLDRPRPSLAYVWSPTPDPEKRPAVAAALRKLPRRRLELVWVRLKLDDGAEESSDPIVAAVTHAVVLRAKVTETVGERALRKLGVPSVRLRPRPVTKHTIESEAPLPASQALADAAKAEEQPPS